MTVQEHIDQGDTLLRIGVPVLCMRAIDKYLDANAKLNDNDPMRITVYARIALAYYKLPKLDKALFSAEEGLKICYKLKESSNHQYDDESLNKFGRGIFIELKSQIEDLFGSLGTEINRTEFDITKRFFPSTSTNHGKTDYPEDIELNEPFPFNKADDIFHVMVKPGRYFIEDKTFKIFSNVNGNFISYIQDSHEIGTDSDLIKLTNISDNPIDPHKLIELGRYKVSHFLDAFRHYSSDVRMITGRYNFIKDKISDDYNEFYCEEFIQDFDAYFLSLYGTDKLKEIDYEGCKERSRIGSIKKIVSDLLV